MRINHAAGVSGEREKKKKWINAYICNDEGDDDDDDGVINRNHLYVRRTRLLLLFLGMSVRN